jgi:hypothetical protein
MGSCSANSSGSATRTAFAALVKRHASMVFGVCRRLVGDVHVAEDAFQAVFIVQRGGRVDPAAHETVGNWLYGVAYRTALKARSMLAVAGREKSRWSSCRTQRYCQGNLARRSGCPRCRTESVARSSAAASRVVRSGRKAAARGCPAIETPPATLANRLASARRKLADR